MAAEVAPERGVAQASVVQGEAELDDGAHGFHARSAHAALPEAPLVALRFLPAALLPASLLHCAQTFDLAFIFAATGVAADLL